MSDCDIITSELILDVIENQTYIHCDANNFTEIYDVIESNVNTVCLEEDNLSDYDSVVGKKRKRS